MRLLTILAVILGTLLPLQGCAPVAVGAAAGTGAMLVDDRRTAGFILEDETIELRTSNRINERFRDQVHASVTSYNRIVLLSGEAPTQELKAEIEKIARQVPNVREVVNDLQIAGPSTYGSRSNDSYLTSKVKTRFVDAGKFHANHVKVVTENGVVYLLGIVKHKEAEDAVEIASTTSGVRKVVKVFEYLD